MSILPLLTLVFVVASVLGGPQFQERLLQMIGQYITPEAQDMFARAMRNRTGQAAASIFSLLLLVWSALRVFRTLDSSFSLFYNTTGSKSIVGQIRDALIVLGALLVALVGIVGVGLGAAFLSIVPFSWLVGPLLLVIPLTLAFLPIYYVFPDTDVTVREVLPGAFVAAVGWAILQVGFHLYANTLGGSEVYGALGAVLLILTWLYIAGLLLLVGVAVNIVLADRTTAALAAPPSRSDVVLGK
jgi:membrane protein